MFARVIRRLSRRIISDASVKHDVRRLSRKIFSDASVKHDVERLSA